MNSMNKIDQQLQKINESGKIGLMTHVVIGYPSIDETKELILALEKGGSDFIELQIPFSDPIADGPTIMEASDVALKNGSTANVGMQMMEDMSSKVAIPLLFMCYYNTVHAYGIKKFCFDAVKAGASGLIIPDVPPEEEQYEKLTTIAEKEGLVLIRIISPASSKERLEKNAKLGKGFIYCVSRYGVTGTKQTLAPELSAYLKKVKSLFSLPRAVGFGISTKEQVQALKNNAEIAVVGSAIIERIKKGNKLSEIINFVAGLKS